MSSTENAIVSTQMAKRGRKFGSVLPVNTPALSPSKFKARKNVPHTTGSLKKRHIASVLAPECKSKSVNTKQKENAKQKENSKPKEISKQKENFKDKFITKNENKKAKKNSPIELMETISEEDLDLRINTFLNKQATQTESTHKWITSAALNEQDSSTVDYHLNLIVARYKAIQETWKENDQLQAQIDLLRKENDILKQQVDNINEVRKLLGLNEDESEDSLAPNQS